MQRTRAVRQVYLKDGSLSEDAFQAQFIGLARFYDWRGYHTADSGGSVPGFPDWVLIRDAQILFVELKAEKGKLAAAQRDWLDAIAVVQGAIESVIEEAVIAGLHPDLRSVQYPWRPAVERHVWRPSDWDTLHARLAIGRVMQPSVNDPRPDAGR